MEAGLEYRYVTVDLQSRQADDGTKLDAVNSKGYVPVLVLESGDVLTEMAAILQYVADRVPESELAPSKDVFERYRLQEWLSFIGGELHKPFGPLFVPGSSEEAMTKGRAKVIQRLTWVDAQLPESGYLLGEKYTVADIYLFVVSGWSRYVGIDVPELKRLGAYMGRIARRPAVQAALHAEGLIG